MIFFSFLPPLYLPALATSHEIRQGTSGSFPPRHFFFSQSLFFFPLLSRVSRAWRSRANRNRLIRNSHFYFCRPFPLSFFPLSFPFLCACFSLPFFFFFPPPPLQPSGRREKIKPILACTSQTNRISTPFVLHFPPCSWNFPSLLSSSYEFRCP